MNETAAAARPLTHRRVLAIAVPIVISNATVPILGIVDTAVVGQLGAAAPIGAVGIGAIILTAIYWLFGFLRMGTVGLTSQALGAGRVAEADAMLSRALLIGAVGGAVVIVLQVPLFWLAFMASPASNGVESLAREYMTIRVWSAPAAIAIFGINGWLIAHERTRSVLVIQLWMNGLNIVLDLWFVLGLGWGVGGVAVATFWAEWSGLALALWLCRGAFRRAGWRDPARVFDRLALGKMFRVNLDILIRSVMIESVFVSFLFFSARFGDVPLAANQILLQFLHITAYALDGFAFAAESLVGNAIGRQSVARVRRSSVLTSVWGLGSGLVLAALFALAGGVIIDIMTTAPDVRAEARSYLVWMVLAPLLGGPAWMLDGIFIGATRTRDMRNMMVLSAAAYFALVLPLMPVWGNHGLWFSVQISFVARTILLGLRYRALEASARAS